MRRVLGIIATGEEKNCIFTIGHLYYYNSSWTMMMERLENAPGDFRPLNTVGSTFQITKYFEVKI